VSFYHNNICITLKIYNAKEQLARAKRALYIVLVNIRNKMTKSYFLQKYISIYYIHIKS